MEIPKFETESAIVFAYPERIHERINLFKKCFPRINYHYAAKGNAEDRLLQENIKLDGQGHFYVASAGEVYRCLKYGTDPKELIFTIPFKRREDIVYCKNNKVIQFGLDTIDELRKYHELYKDAEFYVRVQCDATYEECHLPVNRLGVDPYNCDEILQKFQEWNLNLVGFGFYTGGEIKNGDTWIRALKRARIMWDKAVSYGLKPNRINFGGGMASDLTIGHPADYCDVVNKAIEELFDKDTKFIAEPSRFICYPYFDVLVKVLGVQRETDEQGNIKRMTYVLSDGACGYLRRYQWDHWKKWNAVVYPKKPRESTEVYPARFVGPTLDVQDVIYETDFPLLEEGDCLLCPHNGNYTWEMCYALKGFRARIIYVEKEKEFSVRDYVDKLNEKLQG